MLNPKKALITPETIRPFRKAGARKKIEKTHKMENPYSDRQSYENRIAESDGKETNIAKSQSRKISALKSSQTDIKAKNKQTTIIKKLNTDEDHCHMQKSQTPIPRASKKKKIYKIEPSDYFSSDTDESDSIKTFSM